MIKGRVNPHGFTLIEMVVVIAIIGILSAVLLPNAFKQIEKSKCAQCVEDAHAIKTAALQYYADVNKWPPDFGISVPNPNPFLENPFSPGTPEYERWDGPYLEKWKTHAWGGMERWSILAVRNAGDNRKDAIVVFDDDRPGMGAGDNQGRIPTHSMLVVDRMIDDGDLSTGLVRGDGHDFSAARGEMVIVLQTDVE